jgi:hypothetical protein
MSLDREKAAKVAMLLTSDQPGEVVAAASRLVAMLSAAGMSPADLLGDTDKESSSTNTKTDTPDDTIALRKAHAEIKYLTEALQRERSDYEKMLKQRDDALERVEELEDELESLLPELDWVSLAEAFRRANRRGANSIYAKNLEYFAAIGKLTLAHKRALREFSKSRRGKKAA